MDVKSRRIDIRRVKDVASKHRLLTESDDELMKAIEARSSKVIGQIRNGNLKIKPNDRLVLNQLVFAMTLNDPHNGFDEDGMRNRVINAVTREFVEAIGRQGGLVNYESSKKLIGNYFGYDYLNFTLRRENSVVLKALAFMGLSVHETIEGESLVIGDSPVLVVRGTIDGARSLLYPGSQVILPIQSRLALVYSWETPMNLIQKGAPFDLNQVRSLASDYFYKTDSKYIFGRSHKHVERASLVLLEWTPSVRSMQINDGWMAMMGELQLDYQHREEKEKAQRREFDLIARKFMFNVRQDLEGHERDYP